MKKILWICNVCINRISKAKGEASGTGGGWLDGAVEALLDENGFELMILYPAEKAETGNVGNLYYASFIEPDCKKELESALQKYKPDVIHIWGTEMRHSAEAVRVCQEMGFLSQTAVSIQGLVTICRKYHSTVGIDKNWIDSHPNGKNSKSIYESLDWMDRNSKAEIETIKTAKNIIGRTDWDKANAYILNKDANYFHCNESLRKSFYEGKWNPNNIKRHSIFVSQWNYTIKGFHFLLEAMPMILERFPDTHIYTTGTFWENDLSKAIVVANTNKKGIFRKSTNEASSYELYLLSLIEKYKLEDKITFLGKLSEQEMKEQYLNANVFVQTSTCENSPNSMGEAMLLGCPVVTSDVGGVKSMINHGTEGLVYDVNAPYMLAYYVCRVFEDDELATKLGNAAQQRARVTHDREINNRRLTEIYEAIGLNK